MIASEVRFGSRHLGMRVTMNVLLPDHMAEPWSTLYLLHGLSDDHTIWTRLTSLERIAQTRSMAIVMPQGFRGFYTRNENGPDYEKYVLEDVIGTAERLMPLRRDRAGRHIGGLSMGGYGALRIGLAHPEHFASIHSHSGALGYPNVGAPNQSSFTQAEYRNIFGATGTGTDHDLYELARRLKPQAAPRISIDCGVDDFLIRHNRDFHAALDRMKIAHAYAEFPGAHNWDYWDAHIARAIDFHLGVATA
jgi:putative tributyrin esterase